MLGIGSHFQFSFLQRNPYTYPDNAHFTSKYILGSTYISQVLLLFG